MSLVEENKKTGLLNRPLKKGQGCLVIIGAIILLIIIAFVFGGREEEKGSPSSESTIYSINQDVVVDETRWKVLKVYTKDYLSTLFGRTEKAGGRFVVVHIEVENLSKEAETVSDLRIIDSQGREFISSSKDFNLGSIKQIHILNLLNPNVPFTFAAVYDVPTDANGFRMTVRDLSLSWKKAVIDLGI